MTLRADDALVRSGIAADISLARSLIMEGRALYGTNKILKPSEPIKKSELLRIKGEVDAYVSRGAHKLKKAFEVFDISASGKNCIDVGASTGGFSDVMLRNNAARVYSVDVGFNLLDWKIRNDPRVVCMEKTNARFLEKQMFDVPVTFGATDVSFISLKAVLPSIFNVLEEDADFIALIKPQFEAEKEEVGEKGVVRNIEVHKRVVNMICSFVVEHSWAIKGLDFSPIRGPEGNIEFLLHIRKSKPEEQIDIAKIVDETVNRACEYFKTAVVK